MKAGALVDRHGVYAPLKELPTAGQDKQIRAGAIRGFARQGRVKLLRGDWNGALLDECINFGTGTARNDDQVDCLSLLGRHLAKMSPGTGEVVKPPPKPILGAVTMHADGVMRLTSPFNEIWKDNERLNAGRFKRI